MDVGTGRVKKCFEFLDLKPSTQNRLDGTDPTGGSCKPLGHAPAVGISKELPLRLRIGRRKAINRIVLVYAQIEYCAVRKPSTAHEPPTKVV